MVPETSAGGKAAVSRYAAADKAITDRTGRQVIILARAKDFALAKSTAAALEKDFVAHREYFTTISLENDGPQEVNEIAAFLNLYQFALLDSGTKKLLAGNTGKALSERALSKVYSAFTLIPLDNIERDPFLLTQSEAESLLGTALKSAGALSERDGVLCRETGGFWYVMLRASLTKAGASFSAKRNAVPFILRECGMLEKNHAGVTFFYSGVPFHSYQSSTNAQREISVISAVSLLAVIIILLAAFRAVFPLLASSFAILLSAGTALAGAFIFFPQVHVITFVFGTTLIGCCIDYSIHFWTHRLFRKASGTEARAEIFRSVTMGFVSTELCFAALLFAPFVILRQFAVFSLFGMASSYLTVMGLFPASRYPRTTKRVSREPHRLFGSKRFLLPSYYGIVTSIVLFLIFAVIIIYNGRDVRINNDIRSLYTPTPTMLENEKKVGIVTGWRSAPWYYIVTGESAEDVLRKEESLRFAPNGLDALVADGKLSGYMAASVFVPSIARQKANYAACAALLPTAKEQFEALGWNDAEATKAAANYAAFYKEAAARFVTPDSPLPAALKEALANLYLGEVQGGEGRYYSVVMPVGAKVAAKGFDGVRLVNKAESIARGLDSLTRTLLFLYLAAFIIIAIVVKVCYPWKATLKICAVPLFACAASLAVMALDKIPVSFFPATAFVLVFGLGLDYIFYIAETGAGRNGVVSKAVVLSFATTAVSFGALALSSFEPVRIFALVVFAGITAAFVMAFLLKGAAK
jgi:predicted exporter